MAAGLWQKKTSCLWAKTWAPSYHLLVLGKCLGTKTTLISLSYPYMMEIGIMWTYYFLLLGLGTRLHNSFKQGLRWTWMPVENHFQVFIHLVGHCVKCGWEDMILFSIGNRPGWVILLEGSMRSFSCYRKLE